MSKFKFIKTGIEDLYIIEPTIFLDNRGFFMETYNYSEFEKVGMNMNFVQDNHSLSKKGVLRGLHFQTNNSQGKLVRVIKGEVFDVAVDLRKDSSTFGKWKGIILSEENKREFYIPEGFAHGFLVISDEAEFVYKCTDFYYPEYEGGILWNDKDLAIDWPISENINLTLSDKDKKLLTFKEFCKIHN